MIIMITIFIIIAIIITLSMKIMIIFLAKYYHRPYHDPDLQPSPLPLQSHSKAVKVHSADLGFDVRYITLNDNI